MPPTNGHGLLRVYLASVEGRQVTIRYARPGDVLGIAVLVGGRASVGVQAVEPSGLFRISSRTLIAAPAAIPCRRPPGGSVAKLKELIETGRVRLQNGRVETVSS